MGTAGGMGGRREAAKKQGAQGPPRENSRGHNRPLCGASGARRHWDSGENSGGGMGKGLSFCIIISF